jgi:hypothetical protein
MTRRTITECRLPVFAEAAASTNLERKAVKLVVDEPR